MTKIIKIKNNGDDGSAIQWKSTFKKGMKLPTSVTPQNISTECKLLELLKDWKVESPKAFISWLKPIMEIENRKHYLMGRSEVYADTEKMKDNISMFPNDQPKSGEFEHKKMIESFEKHDGLDGSYCNECGDFFRRKDVMGEKCKNCGKLIEECECVILNRET